MGWSEQQLADFSPPPLLEYFAECKAVGPGLVPTGAGDAVAVADRALAPVLEPPGQLEQRALAATAAELPAAAGTVAPEGQLVAVDKVVAVAESLEAEHLERAEGAAVARPV